MSMNIYARNGDKVVFKYPRNGHSIDQEMAKKYLTLNAIYTVERTIVHSWSTDVFLKEIPGVAFNSALFADYRPKKARTERQAAEKKMSTEEEMSVRKEEILFEFEQWEKGRMFPCTLITYGDGTMDLHAQTGDGHEKAIERAKEILDARGLTVGKLGFIGGSGVYYPVKRKK